MWVTAQECLGLAGFPSAEKNVRARLEKLIEQNFEWKRKRQGTKAFEYYIECLPAEAQRILKEKHAQQIMADASVLPLLWPSLASRSPCARSWRS
ncbi:Uncharacterised protein [Edwardsiella tarda]|nr:Uncharacterised protein [Edwardsiella tarda]